jgi:hypothetical protein
MVVYGTRVASMIAFCLLQIRVDLLTKLGWTNILWKSLLSYYAPISCTQKLKLMGKTEQFTYTSTLPSRAALIGRKCGIGVNYNLF